MKRTRKFKDSTLVLYTESKEDIRWYLKPALEKVHLFGKKEVEKKLWLSIFKKYNDRPLKKRVTADLYREWLEEKKRLREVVAIGGIGLEAGYPKIFKIKKRKAPNRLFVRGQICGDGSVTGYYRGSVTTSYSWVIKTSQSLENSYLIYRIAKSLTKISGEESFGDVGIEKSGKSNYLSCYFRISKHSHKHWFVKKFLK